MADNSVRVTSLRRYPVKSLAGESLEQAALSTLGLSGDRRFAVVEPDGTKVTAREVNAMLGLRARLEAGGVRLVDAQHGAALDEGLFVAEPVDGPVVAVDFSGLATARDAGDAAAEWLSERLGRAVRLVYQDDAALRPVRPELGGVGGELNSLSDAAPVLVTNEASLEQLNDWVERTDPDSANLAMARFRPNVVVAGAPAFAEDHWREVRLGGVSWRATMICDRCVMTSIDPVTLVRGREPVRTLARHRRWDKATWFGVRYAPIGPVPHGCVVRIGDEVAVVASAERVGS